VLGYLKPHPDVCCKSKKSIDRRQRSLNPVYRVAPVFIVVNSDTVFFELNLNDTTCSCLSVRVCVHVIYLTIDHRRILGQICRGRQRMVTLKLKIWGYMASAGLHACIGLASKGEAPAGSRDKAPSKRFSLYGYRNEGQNLRRDGV